MILSSGFQRMRILSFGRRTPFTYPMPAGQSPGLSLADDARLFVTTFLGGLLFMTIYLA